MVHFLKLVKFHAVDNMWNCLANHNCLLQIFILQFSPLMICCLILVLLITLRLWKVFSDDKDRPNRYLLAKEFISRPDSADLEVSSFSSSLPCEILWIQPFSVYIVEVVINSCTWFIYFFSKKEGETLLERGRTTNRWWIIHSENSLS